MTLLSLPKRISFSLLSMLLIIELALPTRAAEPEIIEYRDGIKFKNVGKGFYTVIRPDGTEADTLMDETYVKFLTSTKGNPTQLSLDELLSNVDHVRLLEYNIARKKVIERIVLDVAEPSAVAEFKSLMKIVEDPKSFGHCMCSGGPTIELLKGKDHLANISCQHGFAIRWENWKWDANLKSGRALATWFANHGYRDQLQEMEDKDRENQAYDDFMKSVPKCLPLEKMTKAGWTISAPRAKRSPSGNQLPENQVCFKEMLDREYKDSTKAVAALLCWAGHGAGNWVSIPDHSMLAFNLLDGYPVSAYIEAIRLSPKDSALLEGAGLYALHLPKSITSKLPDDVKKILSDYAAESKIEMKSKVIAAKLRWKSKKKS